MILLIVFGGLSEECFAYFFFIISYPEGSVEALEDVSSYPLSSDIFVSSFADWVMLTDDTKYAF